MVVPVFRKPVINKPIEDTSELIDHLKPLIEKLMSNEVSNIYFGDIATYLPSHFIGPRKEQQAVVVLAPAYDQLIEGTRVASQESHMIGVDIVAIVNITPYYKASPKEAYGERQLVDIIKKIGTFLRQQENVRLDGRVEFFSVEDVNWSWGGDKDMALRAASIRVQARVRLKRL